MRYDLNYLHSLLMRCVNGVFTTLSHESLEVGIRGSDADEMDEDNNSLFKLDWDNILESDKYTSHERDFLAGVMEGVYYKAGEEKGDDVTRVNGSECFNIGFDLGYET